MTQLATAGNFTNGDSQSNYDLGWIAPNILVAPPFVPLPPGRWAYWDGSVNGLVAKVEFSLTTTFATQAAAATTRLPFFWNYWDPSIKGVVEKYIFNSTFLGLIPPPAAAPAYLLLVDHYLTTGLTKAGTIVTEGNQIPVGWTPTPAVDPQNASAIQTFWNVGPYFISDAEESRDFYPFTPYAKPKVYWKQVSPGVYQLTGAGASLGTKSQ